MNKVKINITEKHRVKKNKTKLRMYKGNEVLPTKQICFSVPSAIEQKTIH